MEQNPLEKRWIRRINREKTARQEAERLLDVKSRELWEANQNLQTTLNNLEDLVAQRTAELSNSKEETELSNFIYDSVNRILNLSLQDLPPDQIFKSSLELIVHPQWATHSYRGMIIVKQESSSILNMIAQIGLDEYMDVFQKNKELLIGKIPLSGDADPSSHLAANVNFWIPEGFLSISIQSGNDLLGVLVVEPSMVHCPRHKKLLDAAVPILANIIKKMRLDQSFLQFHQAIEQSPVTVIITDLEGRIEYVNPRFCETSGFSASEVIGQHSRILRSNNTSDDKYRDLWQVIQAGNEWRGEFLSQKKHGPTYWESVSISPIRDRNGNFEHYIAIKEDITLRKEAEQQRILSTEAAENANQAKGNFLANMSHEIRTPMNAVIGMTHLILKTKLTSQQRGYIEKIRTSGESLMEIINDILDFSKIDAEKLVLENVPFRLDDTVNHVASVVFIKAHEKMLEFLIDTKSDVANFLIGDALRLSQVLTNLLTNAIKFTENGEVVLTVSRVESDADSVTLEFIVSDSGIGMTEEQMENLFQPFAQADSTTTRRYGGTGLGLCICQRIVALMQGNLRVESQIGGGSVFSCTIRFGIEGDDHFDASMAFSKHVMARGGIRVLVVEANQKARKILGAILSTLSLSCTEVPLASEAIAEIVKANADNKPYRLVIMTLHIPQMDEIETTRQIKGMLHLVHVPIVILVGITGYEESMVLAAEAGADGFLMKPVSKVKVIDALMEQLDIDFELPPSQHLATPKKTLKSEGSLKGIQILLVEDNPINQQVATELLQSVGIQVLLANDGQEAVDIMLHSTVVPRVDGILMDLQMPIMDGYEATSRILSDARFKDLPIIGLTAHAFSEERGRCLAVGMRDHVGKPIQIEKLFGAIQRHISPNKPIPKPQPFLLPDSWKAALANFTGIDLKMGLERVAGNQQLYLDLLEQFQDNQKDLGFTMENALKAGRLEEVERLAHTCRGVSGNIGAMALHDAASVLESSVRQPLDSSGRKTLLEDFQRELNRVLSLLSQNVFKSLGPVDHPMDGDRSELLNLMVQMRTFLVDFDPNANALFQKVLPLLSRTVALQDVTVLERLVKKFDYRGAIPLVDDMIDTIKTKIKED